jgi:hypothetical protein
MAELVKYQPSNTKPCVQILVLPRKKRDSISPFKHALYFLPEFENRQNWITRTSKDKHNFIK